MEPQRASLSALPSDVLRLVFSFLPPRPQLLAVALVCKRWRGIVISALPWFPVHPSPPRQRFDRIAHLIPPTLRSLHHPADTYVPESGRACACHPLTQLTGLTALSLPVGSCSGRSLNRSLASLTSLTLHHSPFRRLRSDDAFLSIVRLPRLAHLALRWVPLDKPLKDFVSAHASQLTSLEICTHAGFDFRPELIRALPHCVHLKLGGIRLEMFVHLASLAAPTLTAMDLVDQPLLFNPPPELLPLLVRTVRTLAVWTLAADANWTASLPSLRSLALLTPNLGALLPLAQQCHALHLHSDLYLAPALHSRLVRLSLPAVHMLWRAIELPVQFPHLQQVLVQGQPCTASVMLARFNADRFPRLRTLALPVYRTRNTGPQMAAFLRVLERRGAEEVVMRCARQPNRRRFPELRWLAVSYGSERDVFLPHGI